MSPGPRYVLTNILRTRSNHESLLQPHSHILVTGGTGFLGAHVVDLLLERGIGVVVTARSESKAKDFAESRSRFKDLLEVVVTGDLSAVGAFDDLAKDVDVIIHCASVSCKLSNLLWVNRFETVERFRLASSRDHDIHVNLKGIAVYPSLYPGGG